MAKRSKSGLKQLRQSVKRRARNLAVQSRIKTYTKRARTAIADRTSETGEAVRHAIREIDRAAAKGIIHRNAAARRKSRLMLAANKAGA